MSTRTTSIVCRLLGGNGVRQPLAVKAAKIPALCAPIQPPLVGTVSLLPRPLPLAA